MVNLQETLDNLQTSDEEDHTLREERQRTGRYVATTIAIFVSLFGLYQAMARGTPEYAAFFLPALIMFLYIMWILWASRNKHANKISKLQSDADIANNSATENIETTTNVNEKTMPIKNPPEAKNQSRIMRTYSVS